MNVLKLIVSIVICQSAGIVGSFFTAPAITGWYAGINKPSFNPPGWIFGPVWVMLYLLMGISLYLVWNKGPDRKDVRTALVVFGIHLILNSAWSVIFFGMQNPLLAFIEIIVLLAMIIAVIVLFWKIDTRASYLLIPYLLWVSFATVLNGTIWYLNA